MEKYREIILPLYSILADSYALYLKTQNYHWNISGENFYSVHKLLESQYEDMAEAIDEIAERIRILGIKVPATFEKFVQATVIKSGNENAIWKDMVTELFEDNMILTDRLIITINIAEGIKDVGTADILIARSKVHQKNAWFLKMHI